MKKDDWDKSNIGPAVRGALYEALISGDTDKVGQVLREQKSDICGYWYINELQ